MTGRTALLFVTLAALLASHRPALAGEHAGGVLAIVANPSITYTSDTTTYCVPDLVTSACDSLPTRHDGPSIVVASVHAWFSSSTSPRLAGVSFGLDYPGNSIVIVDYGACGAATELRSDGWPAPTTGTAITFATPKTTHQPAVYWFAAYRYYGDPGTLVVQPHPTIGGYFADDGVPAMTDLIAGYGALGFDIDGVCTTPSDHGGGCCLPYGQCTRVTEVSCWDAGGIFLGVGVPCANVECGERLDRDYSWLWSELVAVAPEPVQVQVLAGVHLLTGLDGVSLVDGDSLSAVVEITQTGAESLLGNGVHVYQILGATPLYINPVCWEDGFDRPPYPNAEWSSYDDDTRNGLVYWGMEDIWDCGVLGITPAFWQETNGTRVERVSCNYTKYQKAVLKNDGRLFGNGFDLTYVDPVGRQLTFNFVSAMEDTDELELAISPDPIGTTWFRIPFVGSGGGQSQSFTWNIPGDWPRLYIWMSFISNGTELNPGVPRIERVEFRGQFVAVLPQVEVQSVAFGEPSGVPPTVRAAVSVRNAGSATALSCRGGALRREEYPPDCGNMTLDGDDVAFTIPELPGGSTATVYVDLPFQGGQWIGGGGGVTSYQEFIYFKADVDDWLPESNEVEGPECGADIWSGYCTWSDLTLPHVVLVPGFMGSELDKWQNPYTYQIWSDTFSHILYNTVVTPDHLALDPFTQNEKWGGVAQPVGVLGELNFGAWKPALYITRGMGGGGLLPYVGLTVLEETIADVFAPDSWAGLKSALEMAGYVEGQNLWELPYDWRKDPTQDGIPRLRDLVDDLRNTIPQRDVVVMSHSYGSLVAMGYLKQEHVGPPNVSAWVTFGAPWQGSPEVYTSLMGKTGLGQWQRVPILGGLLLRQQRVFSEGWSGQYCLTPTPQYDRPVYFVADDCTHPCEPGNVDPGVPFQVVVENGVETPGSWSYDANTFDHAADFRDTYVGDVAVENVLHFVNGTRSSIDGTVRFRESGVPDPSGGTTSKTWYLPRWGVEGDGMVPLPSALETQQDNALTLFADERHIGLPSAEGVVQVARDCAMGFLTTPLPWSVSEEPGQWNRDGWIELQFRVYYAWLGENRIEAGMEPPFPVAMEIVNKSQNRWIATVAQLSSENNQDPWKVFPGSVTGEVESTCLDGVLTYRVETPMNGETTEYRLIIVPDPSLWNPVVPAGSFIPSNSVVSIGGALVIRDRDSIWKAPLEADDEWIEFTNIGPYGFSAYVDIHVQNGDIVDADLEAKVDPDGDGIDPVTVGANDGVAGEVAGGTGSLRLFPNPARGEFEVAWVMPIGSRRGEIAMYDVSGRVVETHACEAPTGRCTIESSAASSGLRYAGVYVLVLRSDAGKVFATRKVTIAE